MFPRFPRFQGEASSSNSVAPRPATQPGATPPLPDSPDWTAGLLQDLPRSPPRAAGSLAGRSSLPSAHRESSPQTATHFAESTDPLVMAMEDLPQLEGESKLAHARRLHRERPELSVIQIASLSHASVFFLRLDPAFQELSAEHAALRDAMPRYEREPNQAYALRLHHAHPSLSIPDLARLSGALAFNLEDDPRFHPLSAEQATLREAFPRLERESNLGYACRLREAMPGLTVRDISAVSGAMAGILRQHPPFLKMTAELAALRKQFPRLDGEGNLPYARRLHEALPELTKRDLSVITGAVVAHIRRDAAFQVLTPALAALRDRFPRLEGEENLPYACRLREALPLSSVADIALVAGVQKSDLRRELSAQARAAAAGPTPLADADAANSQLAKFLLPPELEAVLEEMPQFDRESDRLYALRLHEALPHLGIGDIAAMSGVRESQLQKNPAFHELPPELAAVGKEFPRLGNESRLRYARRLQAQQPGLSRHDLSLLSGANEATLAAYPPLRDLAADLRALRKQLPRLDGESSIAYARRLRDAWPELSLRQIADLSGVQEGILRNDRAFQELPPELVELRVAHPQGRDEKNLTYARRLHDVQPPLSLWSISRLSGITKGHLRRDPAFQDLDDALAAAREQMPREAGEKNAAYARRLRNVMPELTLNQFSILSRAAEGHLRQDPEFGQLPPELAAVRNDLPRLPDEKKLTYARRLAEAMANLTPRQIAQLSGATITHVRKLAERRVLTAEHQALRKQLPRGPNETTRAYARRVRQATPQISIGNLSIVVDCPEATLRALPDFQDMAPAQAAELAALRERFPRQDREKNVVYARRLRATDAQLSTPQIASLSSVPVGKLRRDAEFQLAGEHPAQWLATHPPVIQQTFLEMAGEHASQAEARLDYLRLEQERADHAARGDSPAPTPSSGFADELEAQLAFTPAQASSSRAATPAQPQHSPWGGRRIRTLGPVHAGPPESASREQIASTSAQRPSPAASPSLPEPPTAWGARKGRTPRAWELGLLDPGTPEFADLAHLADEPAPPWAFPPEPAPADPPPPSPSSPPPLSPPAAWGSTGQRTRR
jgi:hypothetical protein